MYSPFKAIANEDRRKILDILLTNPDSTFTELSKKFPFTHPALASHLNRLLEAHLIVKRREGRYYFYTLNKKTVVKMVKQLNKILES